MDNKVGALFAGGGRDVGPAKAAEGEGSTVVFEGRCGLDWARVQVPLRPLGG